MEPGAGGGLGTQEGGGFVPSRIAGIERLQLGHGGRRAERIEESEGSTTERRESDAKHRADIAVAR